ncbi:transposase [Polymorphospora sp. NPDC050346]|uniref:transposase n=1 Tax=Polymorphospora sp. NPDC050346 TaxID=3155780 RepID=UPI0033DBC84E
MGVEVHQVREHLAQRPRLRGGSRDHRQVIDGILWRIANGAKWDQIPDRYGPAKTCYDRFARWKSDGTWARIEQQLQTDADAVAIWTGGRRSTPAWCARISMLRRARKGG